MTLDQLLTEIKSRRLILTYNRHGRLVLWSPNTHVPLSIERAIRSHSRALQRLIERSDTSVCVNPGLHRSTWSYRNRRYCCDVCAHLLKEVS